MRIYFFTILVLIGINTLQAQLNIKVGYTVTYTNPSVTNAILNDYNSANEFLTDGFNELHYLHGMQGGLRYRIDDVAFEATWHNKYNTLRSSGLDINDNDISRDLRFRYGSYSLGMEAYLTRNVGLGGTFDLTNVRFRTDVAGVDNVYTISSEWGSSSHFYLSINMPGNDILTFSLKPYVQIPWSSVNLNPLQTELGTPSLAEPNEKYLNFGLQLVFYNGIW